jgi:anti-anti-sigma factor
LSHDTEWLISVGVDGSTARLAGEFDLANIGAVTAALATMLDPHPQVLVDVGGVTFCSAALIGCLIETRTRLASGGTHLALGPVSRQVRRVLDVTATGDLFRVHTPDNIPDRALPPEGRAGDTAVPAQVRSRSNTDIVDAALRLVTAATQATINNADGVSVTLERHGRLMTVAASNDEILEMDRHQYDTGEGPCLAAKADGRLFYIESLDDETRWPTFVPLALAQGIHSVLSSPLMTADYPQGALNIYSNADHAFGAREQELAALFATEASNILTTAGPDNTDEQINQRFTDALNTRRTIAHAEGALMARDHISPAAATAALRRAARTAQRNVVDHAAQIVAALFHDSGSAT